MRSHEFEAAALALVARGFSPLVIAPRCAPRPDGRKPPEGKAPGVRSGGEWHLARDWNRWCREQVNEHMVRAWARMIGSTDDAAIGVACGRGLICIDIDQEEIVAPLLAILPPSPVQKKGRKGLSAFYRGDTDKIRSRNYRTPEKVGLVDLLSEGKQTVLPPSVHPDTGEPYFWWTDDTLQDLSLDDLPELPDNIAEKIGEVLKAFGYDPDAVPRDEAHAGPVALAGGSGAASLFREVNDAALVNLHAWVPHLGLQRCYRAGGGFKAVAEWRTSGSGRPLRSRAPNLSFTSQGIRDFGDGRGYPPIDVVMAALDCTASEALEWLAPRVGVQLHDPAAAALADRILASALRKKTQ